MSGELSSSQLAAFIYQAASFVGSSRFVQLFNSEESRFPVNASPLFERLRHDFLFQIRQSVSYKFSNEYRESSGERLIPVNISAQQIARQLTIMAETILGNKKLPLAERSFTVKRGDKLLDAAFGKFKSTICYQAISSINKQFPNSAFVSTFNEANFISSLGIFIESINTLARETPNKGYEEMLKGMIQNTGYFLEGYPHDVLAHDVMALRDSKGYKYIVARKNYCSTTLLTIKEQDSPLINDPDYFHTAVG